MCKVAWIKSLSVSFAIIASMTGYQCMMKPLYRHYWDILFPLCSTWHHCQGFYLYWSLHYLLTLSLSCRNQSSMVNCYHCCLILCYLIFETYSFVLTELYYSVKIWFCLQSIWIAILFMYFSLWTKLPRVNVW